MEGVIPTHGQSFHILSIAATTLSGNVPKVDFGTYIVYIVQASQGALFFA